MANEISTVGGAIATVGTSIAAALTFGQVESVNNAVKECAKFTGKAAANTTVRHVGETVGTAAATAGVAVAAGVTLGQVKTLNDTVVNLAQHTGDSAFESGKSIVTTVNGLADGTPVLGHIKGGIHYACGDKGGGDRAMKSASRTTGVVAGGIAGIPAGPAGMVAGGIAGGAAMDGITTGVESSIKGRYVPSGSLKAWNDVAEGRDAQTVIGGVVDGMMTPVMDGMGGYVAGKTAVKMKASPRAGYEIHRNSNPALNEFMAEQGRGSNFARGASTETTSFKTARSNFSKKSSRSSGAVSKASDHGSIISKADMENCAIYRGVRKGMSPFEEGGHGSQLGPGTYFTDNVEVAREYATTDPYTFARVPGDVYETIYRGEDFKGCSKYWTRKDGGTVKPYLRQEKYQIIKTGHGNANQYRFSPDVASTLKQNNKFILHE